MLIAKAYRILARRWKTPFGENRHPWRAVAAIVFVEVKARATDDAAEAVTERNKRRIVSAAELWLTHHPGDAQCAIRFDVILIAPGKLPRHIVNAFDTTRDRRRSRAGKCVDITGLACQDIPCAC